MSTIEQLKDQITILTAVKEGRKAVLESGRDNAPHEFRSPFICDNVRRVTDARAGYAMAREAILTDIGEIIHHKFSVAEFLGYDEDSLSMYNPPEEVLAFRAKMIDDLIARYEGEVQALEELIPMKPSELLKEAKERYFDNGVSGAHTYICNAVKSAARRNKNGERYQDGDYWPQHQEAAEEVLSAIEADIATPDGCCTFNTKLCQLCGDNFVASLDHKQMQGFRSQYIDQLIERFQAKGK